MVDVRIDYDSENYRDDVHDLIVRMQREECGVYITSTVDLVRSITKRVDAADQMFSISGSKGHPVDPTARPNSDSPRDVEFTEWGVDAAKPPLQNPYERARFERTLPPRHGEAKLDDYL